MKGVWSRSSWSMAFPIFSLLSRSLRRTSPGSHPSLSPLIELQRYDSSLLGPTLVDGHLHPLLPSPLPQPFLPSRRTSLLCALRRPVTVENRRGRSGRRKVQG